MGTVDSVGNRLAETGLNSIGTELAKQLGMMTLQNIMQETQRQVIPLKDLCNQFSARAEKKERAAVGQEISQMLGTIKEFPDIFVVLESDREGSDEGEVSIQLAADSGIPSLLSGVLKLKGILRNKGEMNVGDLSGMFNESCTPGEKESVGGNPELLKESLPGLPGVFQLSEEMVSMAIENESDEKCSNHDASEQKQSVKMEHKAEEGQVSKLSSKVDEIQISSTVEESVYKGAEVMEDQLDKTKEDGDQNPQPSEMNYEVEHTQSDIKEDEVEEHSEETDDKDENEPQQQQNNIEEKEVLANQDDVKTDDQGTPSNIQIGKVEEQSDQSDEKDDDSETQQEDSMEDHHHQFHTFEGNDKDEIASQQQQNKMEEMSSDNKDIGTDELANQDDVKTDDQGTLSNIQVGKEEEQSDQSDEEEDSKTQQESSVENHHQFHTIEDNAQEIVNVEAQVGEGQTSSSGTSPFLNDDSSSQVSVSSASVSAVEEQEDDIPTKLAKQLGVITIKQILKERGKISLQLLACIFGGQGSKEERDAVGRKAGELLKTLQQFSDVFAFESLPVKGGNLYDQEFISLKSDGDDETSLAFARAILHILDILEEKESLTIKQLSTYLNQNSTLDERSAAGRNPAFLEETLLALPQIFHVLDERVCVIKQKQSTKKEEGDVPNQAASASIISNQFDCTFVNKHLGVLILSGILKERATISLQKLCSEFGGRANDDEREAVGYRAMVILETLKQYPDIFDIKSPKVINVQTVVNETKISLKAGTNETPVPYARAMFKLIWFLKEKGTLNVIHLSTCFGQNSSVMEREAVGKNPGTLKKTLKSLPKMFKVSGDNISLVEDAHTYAAKCFVLPKEKAPQPDNQMTISNNLRKKVVAIVIECAQSRNGSCDLAVITQMIKNRGTPKMKETFENKGRVLLKLLKTMPDKFRCEGSHVYHIDVQSNGSGGGGAFGYAKPNLGASPSYIPSAVNPIPVQGVLPKSQAKVIPSIEIVFDTKNSCGNGLRDVSVCQVMTTGSNTQSRATNSSMVPIPLMSIQPHLAGGMTTNEKIHQFYREKNVVHTHTQSQTAQQTSGSMNQLPPTSSNSKKTSQQSTLKQSGLERLTDYLEQCKIATVIQLGGVVARGTAAERQAVGKSPGLLYDTLSSLPGQFVIVGPFIGVTSQRALVTGIAKLVTFLESKGKCEVTSLMGRLGHNGTSSEQVAIGKDIQTFIQTISSIPGVFILEGTSVYLKNGTKGKPHASTPMDKTTAINQNVGWALSAGTSALDSSRILLTAQNGQISVPSTSTSNPDSYASAVTNPSGQQNPQTPSFTLTVVAITDKAMCQDFVQQCLAKYDYPIISLAVNKTGKWLAIAGWEDHVYLFDMEGATGSSRGGMDILADVMANDKVLKVVQNCKYVSTVLSQCYGFKLGNIFDTKVAYQLLKGESNVSINQLCSEYGVVPPGKWKVKMSGEGGVAAGTASNASNLNQAAWARVLIPQIYQHMVMQFSDDSLREVGKLCEAFLHKEDDSVSPDVSAASANNTPMSVQSPQPSTSNGYAGVSASARSSDVPSQADPSFGQKELSSSSSFEATHSKVTPPVLNPWGITQQLRDQFAYRNKYDLNKLMAVLGEDITRNLTGLTGSSGKDELSMLTEVTLDCGRFAQARFYQKDCPSGSRDVNVSSSVITQENIQSILDSDLVTTPTPDRRAGIEDTLHRLGIITNRSGRAIGLTALIGRSVLGCVDHIADLIQDGQSVVMLGSPGVGMTTVLREIARVLSDIKKRRVVIIDTYNQIGGDSDVPHTSIGSARRLQVASRTDQYKTMVEAVQNHNPQTVIIEEIATAPEAQAARNLVQRGVQVITTAHSRNFVDFFQNPEFKAVTGVVQGVVGSEAVGAGNGNKKTVFERQQDPAFQVLIELCERDRWMVYKDLAIYIDYYLQGIRPIVQERQRTWHYDQQGAPTGPQCTVKLIEAPLPSPSPLGV